MPDKTLQREKCMCFLRAADCVFMCVCICGYRLHFSEGQIIFWVLGVSSMDVGRYGEGSKLQSPMLYLLSSPRAQAVTAAHQPAPAGLGAARFTPVQSAWNRHPDGSQTIGSEPGFMAPGLEVQVQP